MSLRALVVDDHPLNLKLARAVLAKLGVPSDGAEDGQQALAALASGTYDLVLMDVQMPVMDGLEATRAIRQQEAAANSKRLPIIGVTGASTQAELDDCLAAGMDHVLTKPFKPLELAALINRLWPGAVAP